MFLKRIFPIMAFIPIVHRTGVNLPKSEFLAGKNLKKVIAAGEGKAQRISYRISTGKFGDFADVCDRTQGNR